MKTIWNHHGIYIATGTKFVRRGRKHKVVETVVDVHITRNLAGDIVKTRYVTEHDVMGKPVRDYDTCATTIKKGLISS